MPKHLVKCPGCGQTFDANQEEYILKSRRYWHKKCLEEAEASETQEEKDLATLFKYCSQLFGKEFNFKVTERLAKKYKNDYGYSYSGMLRTLKYHYEVRNNPTDKSNGTIGIVPYQYDAAYRYYYDIWLANQNNEPKILERYEPKVIEITIPEPMRAPSRRKRFTFLDLDEEVSDGE